MTETYVHDGPMCGKDAGAGYFCILKPGHDEKFHRVRRLTREQREERMEEEEPA